jgi:hypothetical protein
MTMCRLWRMMRKPRFSRLPGFSRVGQEGDFGDLPGNRKSARPRYTTCSISRPRASTRYGVILAVSGLRGSRLQRLDSPTWFGTGMRMAPSRGHEGVVRMSCFCGTLVRPGEHFTAAERKVQTLGPSACVGVGEFVARGGRAKQLPIRQVGGGLDATVPVAGGDIRLPFDCGLARGNSSRGSRIPCADSQPCRNCRSASSQCSWPWPCSCPRDIHIS